MLVGGPAWEQRRYSEMVRIQMTLKGRSHCKRPDLGIRNLNLCASSLLFHQLCELGQDNQLCRNIYRPQSVSPVTKISKTHPPYCLLNVLGIIAVKKSEQEDIFVCLFVFEMLYLLLYCSGCWSFCFQVIFLPQPPLLLAFTAQG